MPAWEAAGGALASASRVPPGASQGYRHNPHYYCYKKETRFKDKKKILYKRENSYTMHISIISDNEIINLS